MDRKGSNEDRRKGGKEGRLKGKKGMGRKEERKEGVTLNLVISLAITVSKFCQQSSLVSVQTQNQIILKCRNYALRRKAVFMIQNILDHLPFSIIIYLMIICIKQFLGIFQSCLTDDYSN